MKTKIDRLYRARVISLGFIALVALAMSIAYIHFYRLNQLREQWFQGMVQQAGPDLHKLRTDYLHKRQQEAHDSIEYWINKAEKYPVTLEYGLRVNYAIQRALDWMGIQMLYDDSLYRIPY